MPHFLKMPTSQNSTIYIFSCRNRKNIVRNEIIISVLLIKVIFLRVNKYIFQLTKYEHKDIRESIESDDNNFSSISFAE